MKRDERKDDFFEKNVSELSNPPDELAQNVSKKNPFRTNYSPIFPSKVQNLTVFPIIYMIRIRFFGPGELIQNEFSAAQYRPTSLQLASLKKFSSPTAPRRASGRFDELAGRWWQWMQRKPHFDGPRTPCLWICCLVSLRSMAKTPWQNPSLPTPSLCTSLAVQE